MASEQFLGLHKELAGIISRYSAIDSMRPDVSELAKTPSYFNLFRDVLENHISLIKTRPQAFEHGKVTVYDRALLILSSNGKNPLNLGAMELFLDEFLGVNKDAQVGDFDGMLEKNIALRSMLWHVTHSKKENYAKECHEEPSAEATTEVGTVMETTDVVKTKEPVETKGSQDETNGNSNAVSKLLETLQRAETEFHEIDDEDKAKKYLAAKFLRDTAENTMTYFHENGLHKHEMMPRIKEAYRLGHKKTIAETGGKLRPFEMDSKEYGHRHRRLRNGRNAVGRADCYRPGERRRSSNERIGRYTRRL